MSEGSLLTRGAADLGDIRQAEALSLLGSVEDAAVAAIVTDPPYGIAYHSNRHEGRNPHAPIAHDWNFQIASFFGEAERVLRPGGAIYLFTRWDVFPLWAREVPTSLTLGNLIVWDKGNHSSGDLTGNFGFQHELIMFITKGRHRLRSYRWSNLWRVPKVPHKKLRMPAEKPLDIYRRAIESSSEPGDLVVDPFGGSGTLAEAAAALGRRFLVGDIDAGMVAMARRRVGLTVSGETSRAVTIPRCPIVRMEPPSPALWGLHPEDFADWRAGGAS